MAEMVAIKNGEGKVVGYRGVKYVNGEARDNGKSFNAQGTEVKASRDAIARAQSINRARRANPAVNPNVRIDRLFGRG